MAVRPVLGRADKHFDDVIVQAVIKLPLESPLELEVIEVPGMKFEVVGMHRDWRIPELNDDFNGLALGPRRKIEQGMLVKFQLRQHTLKPRVWISHPMILSCV